MKEFLIFTLISIIWATLGYTMGLESGKNQKLTPTSMVSEELEMACLSLWVGEQNKKWFEKYGK